ncbi:MAG: hypothetical protein PHU85_03530 [Phycisphaerae bacterium]|nr:hypothetical protein [Phycisphaerae bacterium]
MKKLLALLIGAMFTMPVLVACEENEVHTERREKIEHRSEPTPIVVPDAPQK